MKNQQPLVGIIMGSDSDLDVMNAAAETLKEFDVAFEMRIVSAHRTPDMMATYATEAKSKGLKVIIAGAGGSAHLPGMTASHCQLPVLAVPIKRNENDHEALWSNIKMPSGVPLATMPENGATNAALMAVEILSLSDASLAAQYEIYKKKQRDQVIASDQKLRADGSQESSTKL